MAHRRKGHGLGVRLGSGDAFLSLFGLFGSGDPQGGKGNSPQNSLVVGDGLGDACVPDPQPPVAGWPSSPRISPSAPLVLPEVGVGQGSGPEDITSPVILGAGKSLCFS